MALTSPAELPSSPVSSLRLLNSCPDWQHNDTAVRPHEGDLGGKCRPGIQLGAGDPGTPSTPQFWVILSSSPAQCKYVLILKHLQCLGAGCQEMVGSSQRWGGARPWGDRVPREPPCQAETGLRRMSNVDEVASGPFLSGRGWAEQGSSLVGDLILATGPSTLLSWPAPSPPVGFYATQCPPLGS